MLALSGLCEGFAQGWACLDTACPEQSRRARLPYLKQNSSKSNHSRTYEPFTRKPNHSRTYAIPRGRGGAGHTNFRAPMSGFLTHFLCALYALCALCLL